MYNFYLIMKLFVLCISASISNYTTEFKIRSLIKYHNRKIKKVIKCYNENLKKMSLSIKSKIKFRDEILNDRNLQKHFSVKTIEMLENYIKEFNENIVSYHNNFLNYLKVVFDKSKGAINKYNEMAEKTKNITFIFYKCKKISMNEIIHDVKYPNR